MDEHVEKEIKEKTIEETKEESVEASQSATEKPKYDYPMWMKKRIGEPGNYKWVPVVEEDFKNWIHLPNI